jgi:AcrR family transcriptional regulator
MIPTEIKPTKKQLQGEQSRELILDATERLMATHGYAATSISDIRKACGLPPSSIYWHFGSKEGVLAAVMQRGADRFFAAIPTTEDVQGQAGRAVEVAIATSALLAAVLHAVAGAQR